MEDVWRVVLTRCVVVSIHFDFLFVLMLVIAAERGLVFNYTSNLPNRSGTFKPFELFWNRWFASKGSPKGIGAEQEMIFPDDSKHLIEYIALDGEALVKQKFRVAMASVAQSGQCTAISESGLKEVDCEQAPPAFYSNSAPNRILAETDLSEE